VLALSPDGGRASVASGQEIVECDAEFKPLRRLELPGGAVDIEEFLEAQNNSLPRSLEILFSQY